MSCKICKTRRPRRFCPGVRGDICSVCCGAEREITVDCPFDCEFLLEARKREKLPTPVDPPNQDIKLTERFLRDNESRVLFLGRALLHAALGAAGVDSDVREALEALIRTYRTLESGLYYETRPANPVAARICQLMQEAVAEYRRGEQQHSGVARTRDADVLGILAFLERTAILRNNGRKRGRAFLHYLLDHFPELGPLPGAEQTLVAL